MSVRRTLQSTVAALVALTFLPSCTSSGGSTASAPASSRTTTGTASAPVAAPARWSKQRAAREYLAMVTAGNRLIRTRFDPLVEAGAADLQGLTSAADDLADAHARLARDLRHGRWPALPQPTQESIQVPPPSAAHLLATNLDQLSRELRRVARSRTRKEMRAALAGAGYDRFTGAVAVCARFLREYLGLPSRDHAERSRRREPGFAFTE
jgi:hypothetical protein